MASRRPIDHDPEDPDEWDDFDADVDLPSEDGQSQTETGFCPECAAEIYDAADVCPKCFAWIDGETLRRSPRTVRARGRWTALVICILIASIAIGAGILWITAISR